MDIEELTDDEWTVLAGLARLVIHADEDISPAAQNALAHLQQRVGGIRWNAAVRAARRRFPTLEALEEHARDVVRPEARQAIYRALVDLVGTEGEVLRWVVVTWGVDQG